MVEAYKALRTNLLFSGVDKELKTVVVTSAVANEGKSRTAANLAVVLAQAGHRTLLVDADFRRPSQHRIFGRVRNVGAVVAALLAVYGFGQPFWHAVVKDLWRFGG